MDVLSLNLLCEIELEANTPQCRILASAGITYR